MKVANRFAKTALAAALALGALGAAVAGTSNITGSANTTLDLAVRQSPSGTLKGLSDPTLWKWNLSGGNGVVEVANGYLNPQNPTESYQIPFTIQKSATDSSKFLTVTQISSGKYQVDYYFIIHHPVLGNRAFSTYTILDIVQSGSSFTVSTEDSDSDGIPGHEIPAGASTPPLPYGNIQQEWSN